ncbi:hypothetical protein cand_037100 [Cryptosporidium andersoni]|uniref:Beta-Casp domain-containing protein n=1 Tax=Cryptosporidium andersoni TaxID=117008 RepID=A0A1J4MVA4_9CRYT|nr:hypothetical protein cand_037100 [Cryptosporidium andersoni]
MNVIFPPLSNVDDSLSPVFSIISFHGLNILCDCPLLTKYYLKEHYGNTLDKLITNIKEFNELDDYYVFPATILLGLGDNRNENIPIDLILITHPDGLMGIPFHLHYNQLYRDYNLKHNGCEKETNLESLKQDSPEYILSLLSYLSCIDISNALLAVTPPVFQSATVALQQLIQYSETIQSNISNPFIWLRTSDIFNLFTSLNKLRKVEGTVECPYKLDKSSTYLRHQVITNLPESGPEYFYNQSIVSNTSERNNFTGSADSNMRGSTTGLGAAVGAATHIFDGNTLYNYPATIGGHNCTSSTSNPPLIGPFLGEEISGYARGIIESELYQHISKENDITNQQYISNSIFTENSRFSIKLLHIGQREKICKNLTTFILYPLDSGYCLGGVGYCLATNNRSPENSLKDEKIVIFGQVSTEVDRYPSPLNLNDIHEASNVVFYGNIISMKQAEYIHKIAESTNIVQLSNLSYYLTEIKIILNYIKHTLYRSGSILIPTDLYGQYCMELIEYIGQYVSELPIQYQVPIYIVGGGISTILSNADVSSEWTCSNKSRKSMLPNPISPFLFSQLKSSNRLYTFHTIEELSIVYREPAIFFASSSDLSFGPWIRILNQLYSDPKNTLLTIDPRTDISYLTMKYNLNDDKIDHIELVYFPLILFPTLNSLMTEIFNNHNSKNPKFKVLIPLNKNNHLKDSDIINFPMEYKTKILEVPRQIQTLTRSNDENGAKYNWFPASLSFNAKNKSFLKSISQGVYVGRINAIINCNEGNISIEEFDQDQNTATQNTNNNVPKEKILMGYTTVYSILSALRKHDINDAVILKYIDNTDNSLNDRKNLSTIFIPSLSCTITLTSSCVCNISTTKSTSRNIVSGIMKSLVSKI